MEDHFLNQAKENLTQTRQMLKEHSDDLNRQKVKNKKEQKERIDDHQKFVENLENGGYDQINLIKL